jgi:xanthine dehydrogenase accessory factor
MSWIETVRSMTTEGSVVRVTVIRAEGSTPRELGASMLVTPLGASGTIGGGALEFDAIKAARALLEQAVETDRPQWVREVREYPLGPALCQCCGGFAWVLFEVFAAVEGVALAAMMQSACASGGVIARHLKTGAPLRFVCTRGDASDLPAHASNPICAMLTGREPARVMLVEGSPSEPAWLIEPLQQPMQTLYLYGAGHVGREVVRIAADLGFQITWVDTDAARFPDVVPSHARAIVAVDPAVVADASEVGAFHLVMTYSHALDEAICRAVLRRGDFAFLGLIGSKTKRARFVSRMRTDGFTDAQLKRLVSPIGIDGLFGKEPAVIAVSVAAQLLLVGQDLGRDAGCPPCAQGGHALKAVANST